MVFGMCVFGRIFFTSHALLTANHQYLVGRSEARIQLRAILTMVCQWRSTRPFWSCLLGGAACIVIFFPSKNCLTLPEMILGSKSVRISFGVTPS